MRYALDFLDRRIEASPQEKFCTCPICGGYVIPKCGSIVVWHWAHANSGDCDSWSEGETAWHRDWKSKVLPEKQEVKIGCHRADIVGNRNTVVELQHSPISPEEIYEREVFYGNMIWLFDASEFKDNLQFRSGKEGKDASYRSFKWKWPRKSHFDVASKLFWDVPQTKFSYRVNGKSETRIRERHIFLVKKFHENGNGWGHKLTVDEFVRGYLSDVLVPEAKP